MEAKYREQPTGIPAHVSNEIDDLESENEVGSPQNTSLQEISKDKLTTVLTVTDDNSVVNQTNPEMVKSPESDGMPNVSVTETQVSPAEDENLGKFKSVQALRDAYTNLESEFTKKCQKLREMEQETMSEAAPVLNLEDALSHFLAKNNTAAAFSEELRNYISEHPELKKVENPFENAWAGLVLNHVQNFQKANDDKIVNQYVFSNDAVRQTILERYLDELKQQKSPIVISSQQGERVSGNSLSDTPSTLQDAKTIVEKMFS